MPTDKQLVAHSQDYEIDYIVQTYKIPREDVEKAMLQAGKNGKYCRSRKKIYKVLREMGYEINVKN